MFGEQQIVEDKSTNWGEIYKYKEVGKMDFLNTISTLSL